MTMVGQRNRAKSPSVAVSASIRLIAAEAAGVVAEPARAEGAVTRLVAYRAAK
jgi:hypothetical protein